MTGIQALVPLLVLLLLAAQPLRAEEEAPPDSRIRAQVLAWLDDLRSPEFAVREAARKGLAELGPRVPELLEARRDDEDPEVRRTVRLLLDRLGRGEPEPAVPSGDLAALGRVTLRAKGTLPFLLDALAEGRGVSFALPEDVGEGWVEVALDDVPFFEALGAVARGGGLAARAPFDPAGRMTLTRVESSDLVPTSAAGPLRVTLAEVTSVRTLGTGGSRRRYVVGLDLDWLPSVHLTQRRTPRDLVAVDASGRGFKPGGSVRNTSWGYSASTRSVRIDIHLEPDDPEAVEHLEELSFTLPVRLRHDRQEVVFEGLADLELPVTRDVARPSGAGVDRVTLRGVDRPDGERGPLVVDLLTHLEGKTAGQSLAVVLLHEDGTARPATSGSRFPRADGTLGFRARTWNRGEQPPVAVRVTWFRVEEEGELAFSLSGIALR